MIAKNKVLPSLIKECKIETIKYYDRIHNKFIDLEVNDEVAQFLCSDNKRLKHQQKGIGDLLQLHWMNKQIIMVKKC